MRIKSAIQLVTEISIKCEYICLLLNCSPALNFNFLIYSAVKKKINKLKSSIIIINKQEMEVQQ